MDNPNDFIHIDEVFKRLKDREEPEPSGAWMRMQDLLNEEMPVGAPAAGSMLRRYMIPLVALLLIGSGVAYYNLKGGSSNPDLNSNSFASNHLSNTNNLNDKNAAENAAINNSLSEKTTGSNSNKNHSDKSGTHESVPVAASLNEHAHPTKGSLNGRHRNLHTNNRQQNGVDAATSPSTVIPENNVHQDPNSVAGRNIHTNTQGLTAHNTKNKHSDKITGNTHKNTTTQHQNTTIAEKQDSKKSSSNIASNTTVITEQPSGNTTAAKPVALEQQNVVEHIYPSSGDNSMASAAKGTSKSSSGNKTGKKGTKGNHSNANSTTVPGMNIVATNWNNNKIVEDQTGSYYKEVRDTFKKIDMLSHTVASNNNGAKVYVNKVDTLAITRVERIKFVPLEPLEMAALRQAKIIPQAALIAPIPVTKLKEYMISNEMVNLVPLANYKVNSRKVDPSKFNQLMTNTTQGISNYFDGTNKFYAAILVGGNGFMGNPGAFGMQLGIAGLYQLSERLTLDAEFKFANHYFSNYTINDQSVSFENVSSQQVSGAEWLFKGTQVTTTSAYKINSFAELQLPVTLSYSFGRLSVFGGLNMAYAFPVKWNQATNVSSTQDVSATQTQNSNPFLSQNGSIDQKKDFDTRFGFGYVGGLSYDINRKISLDARITQNLWSSYNGNADAINKLFKTPTFQFSIGYFFGRKERVVYIMDKR